MAPKKPESILLGDKADQARESDVLRQARYDRLFMTSELMPAIGAWRTFHMTHLMSLLGGKADMPFCAAHVCGRSAGVAASMTGARRGVRICRGCCRSNADFAQLAAAIINRFFTLHAYY
jgi:hypothetical protein